MERIKQLRNKAETIEDVAAVNSKEAIKKRLESGKINRQLVFLAVMWRPALFLAVQGAMVLLFRALGKANPALL